MRCTWCGGDHPAAQHYALGRRARWWEEEYPFREPLDMASPVVVTLTPDEVKAAEDRARRIVAADDKAGWKTRFTPGGGETQFDVHARGAGAELAARNATGLELHWDMLPPNYRRKNKPHDLGQRTEVRNAKSDYGRLPAHPDEPKKWVFLLVTGGLPVFSVRGWLEGVDLMVPQRWLEPPEVRYADYFADVGDVNPLPLPEDA